MLGSTDLTSDMFLFFLQGVQTHTMEQTVAYHVIQLVKISSVIKMEDAMNATETSMVIIVIYPVLMNVVVHVIEMESVDHVTLVSMDMIVMKIVRLTVWDSVSRELESASVAKIRCMVINVSLHAQRTVEVSVTKVLETAQVANLDTMVLNADPPCPHVLHLAVASAMRVESVLMEMVNKQLQVGRE